MRRRKKIVIATAIVLGIAVYICVALSFVSGGREETRDITASQKRKATAPMARRAESPLIGKPAPSFTLQDLNGKQVTAYRTSRAKLYYSISGRPGAVPAGRRYRT